MFADGFVDRRGAACTRPIDTALPGRLQPAKMHCGGTAESVYIHMYNGERN